MLIPQNKSTENSVVYLFSFIILPKLIHQKVLSPKHGLIATAALLFLCIICAFPLPCIAGNADSEKSNNTLHILNLNSYHQGFKWTDDIVAAIIATTSAELNNIEYHIEYMDSKRHPNSQLNDMLSKKLALKYQRLQPNIIITSDDNALAFIEEHHQKLFPKVPVIFC